MSEESDIRQTRAYQEARTGWLKEGVALGLEIGIEIGIEKERQRCIEKMGALKIPHDTIVDLFQLPRNRGFPIDSERFHLFLDLLAGPAPETGKANSADPITPMT